jgi:starch synthase
MRVLYVASEAYPLLKTGGLGDVIGALPAALRRCGVEVRVLLPGFPEIRDGIDAPRRLLTFGPVFGASVLTLVAGRLPKSDVGVYVIDAPFLYARPGNPYVGPDGSPWRDNPLRFGLLGWVAAHLAGGELDPRWKPQIVHGHDWHAGLAPVFLSQHPVAPARTVFTIHNLAFQGLFSLQSCAPLGLPPESLTPSGLEFHGQVSFMKAGLTYSDELTTVSPSYAREILTPDFGFGLEGVLAGREGALTGLLNGVDYDVWNPESDKLIAQRYDADRLVGKAACKAALRRELGLEEAPGQPLLAVVSRLTEQKGLDLLLHCLPRLVQSGAQLVVLGSGDAVLEDGFRHVGKSHPGSVAVRTGFDEALSHRIFAGADMVLVPSRFEPCGLTQLYGLRYGAVPIVHRVGGLADSVVDATAENLAAQLATGFVFTAADAGALAGAIDRAIALYRQPHAWRRLAARAMTQDFSWDHSAGLYTALYRRLLGMAAPLAVAAPAIRAASGSRAG